MVGWWKVSEHNLGIFMLWGTLVKENGECCISSLLCQALFTKSEVSGLPNAATVVKEVRGEKDPHIVINCVHFAYIPSLEVN